MKPQDFFDALVAAGGIPEKVERLPGAFSSWKIGKNTFGLRDILIQIASLPKEEQSSFIKSLALYKQTVGGCGSPTLLRPALQIVDDPKHELLDWVLTNTISYKYYSRAKNFAEFQQNEEAGRAAVEARRAAALVNILLEAKRVAEAKVRRTEKASGNLINAIRRGDIKAVAALLRQCADCLAIKLLLKIVLDFWKRSSILMGWSGKHYYHRWVQQSASIFFTSRFLKNLKILKSG